MWYEVSYMRQSEAKSEVTVPAVERAFDILELLEAKAEPMTLAQVVTVLSLPKASVYRLLSTLVQRGICSACQGCGDIRWGLRSLSLAARAQERLDVVQIAVEPMRKLAVETGEACQISVRSGRFALCVARVSSPDYPDLSLIGKAGLALSAACSCRRQRRCLRLRSRGRAGVPISAVVTWRYSLLHTPLAPEMLLDIRLADVRQVRPGA